MKMMNVNSFENTMKQMLMEESNMTVTQNGAATYRSTLSDCLDLFATVGALRHASDDDIINRFIHAYAEDRDVAMKILFFARDVRGGLGERQVFRTIMRWLADNETESVVRNVKYIAEFGRFDDIVALIGTAAEKEAIEYLKAQMIADMEALNRGDTVSLLGKWLPSVNASSVDTVMMAKRIASDFGMSQADYRKALSALRGRIHIIENNLRECDYTFDYENQTSKSLFKYRKAFLRNDGERYQDYMAKVRSGEKKLNTSNVAPYELVDAFIHNRGFVSKAEIDSINTTWAALPDFGNDENMLAVVDTSGSMYSYASPSPASVAFSLGLYIAERNKGAFKNCFVTFSERPKFIELKGNTFTEKLKYAMSFNEVANTDIAATFDLILNAAIRGRVSQDEIPSKLVIISDMEFDSCARNSQVTNFEMAKKKFASHGYTLPDVIFWNVNSINRQQPVTMNEQGVALVSGCTPNLFSMVAGGIASPYAVMMDVISRQRYACICA